MTISRLFKYAAILAVTVALPAGTAAGQDTNTRIVRKPLAAALQATPAVPLSNTNAAETLQEFTELLGQYPPTLVWALQIDPTLMTNKEYLAPYPALGAFLSKHPEILRNPTYFLGNPKGPGFRPGFNNAPSSDAEVARQLAVPTAVCIVLVSVTIALAGIVKAAIEHSRWNRASKAQNEIHVKLMERFTSSEDLLAYIQSPAGRRFFESGPLVNAGRAIAAPFNSILWSVQTGVVLLLGGFGLNYATYHISYLVSQPLFVLSVLGISVGAGFIVSAFASYLISMRMGLFQGTSEAPRS
jgi:ABC-type Fe3+-siderophore transport system permease subunit